MLPGQHFVFSARFQHLQFLVFWQLLESNTGDVGYGKDTDDGLLVFPLMLQDFMKGDRYCSSALT